MSALFRRTAVLATAVLVFAVPVRAQETGHGDLFGDLVHILRNPATGQPILQKQQVLLPQDVPGIAYCPVPVDINGVELPLIPLSCDVVDTELWRVVPVDYFGRLSGGRTRERNLRMHFDEVILTIQEAEVITLDPAGRLKFGTGCTGSVCTTWKVIDSPLENMSFYHRLMKYGHIQTDPLEEDTSFHGDPALGTVYHPALREEDWAKFTGALTALLPRSSASQCFSGTSFVAACAAPQSLTAEDFVRAASFLGGAADKHGRITMDLVQYFNRILRITLTTPESAATLDTLPALIRDENGVITPAIPGMDPPADELFVDFGQAAYFRDDRFNTNLPALVSGGPGVWNENPAVELLPYLGYVHGPAAPSSGIDGFIRNSADALRAIEFIHEYEIPADLYAVYAAATTVTVAPQTVLSSTSNQDVTLSATVTNGTPVNDGTVTFTVKTADGLTVVGAPVVSGTVTSGAASATYVLPGGTPPQDLQVVADYSGAFGFKPGTGIGTLTISPDAPVDLSILNASQTEGTGSVSLMAFELTLAKASTVPVSVQYATTSYTAVAPDDYLTRTGTATFSPGVTSVTVTIPLIPDTTPEPDESFSLVLSAPTNAVLVKSVATGLIVDDDGGAEPVLDFNQDGFADLVWRHASDGRIALWFMNGTAQLSGTLTDPFEVTDLGWEIRGVGDFNGDWKPDMIWQHAGTGALSAWFFDAAVRTGTRDLATLAGASSEPDLDWKIRGAGDMNGDGQQDLLWQHRVTGELRIWHMNGTTQIDSAPIALGVAGTDWRVAAVADMNGDGRDDLVWQNPTTGGVAAWLMNDAQVLAAEWLVPDYVADLAWTIAGARDLNGDGQTDLVWQHAGTGALAAWFMNGLMLSSTSDLTPAMVIDTGWKIVGAR